MEKPLRTNGLKRRQRGAALVEFAVVTPIFITLLLWSMYFTELVRAKLRLMESARYIAWEMTSYPISDFDTETWDHDKYFDDAKNEVMTEATTRFADLDSVDQRKGLASMIMTNNNFTAQMQNQNVPLVPQNMPNLAGAGSVLSAVASVVNGAMGAIMGGVWKFNMKGKVQVDVSVDVQNVILPKSYNDQSVGQVQKEGVWGGAQLNNKTLRAKYVMITNGWHIRDGADALMDKDMGNKKIAGGHNEDGSEHPLRNQVSKMVFGGAADWLVSSPIGQVYSFFSQWGLLPEFLGTYVVSYNFDHNSPTDPDNGCTGSDTSGNNNVGGISGYIDLNQASELDEPELRCFNTAPFRDTTAFQNGESLYREMFNARGEWFMGCKNAQADDPTVATDPNATDKANKVACGN